MTLTLPLDDEVRRLSGELVTVLAQSGRADPDIVRNLAALAFYVGELTAFTARLSGRESTEALAAVFVVVGEGYRENTLAAQEDPVEALAEAAGYERQEGK